MDVFIAIFRMPVPGVLFPGTDDRIELTVQDDLTPQTLFEGQTAGWAELLVGG